MSDLLAAAGLLVAAAAGGTSMLLPAGRPRSLAMLAALALFPLLILGDQWHSAQIADLRHHVSRLALLALLAALCSAALAVAFRRRFELLPLAIVAVLPFRVPLHAGGDTANLLVPLYLVIAGGVLATAWRDWGEARPRAVRDAGPRAWVPRLLAAALVLYAFQALYSVGFSKGLQNVCFFLVPFALAYALISDVRWERRLLVLVLWVIGVEALAFVAIGSVEYLSRELFWNDVVIRSNEFHTYFRVNSVFWDPNIYGRYLALVATIAMAAALWGRERRDFALLTALIAIVWVGLVPTYSESSFLALLAGLAVLAALRWSWRRTLVAAAIGLLAILAIVGASGKLRPNILLSGRANLISGGLELWTERPLWGYGSGGFQKAYREHREHKSTPVSISHTEPVTVLAEQGLVGFALYLALLVAALWALGSGMWSTGEGRGPPALFAARAAILAAFVALLVHTMAYAGFYEDPITWALLAAGVSLAAAPGGPAVRDPA
ncbi:MAG TPA: O-antigen ligase family protein [Solirubrobacterales bacterium]|nr:O-antigen ligase family protein [Solirubrobacterales bacterium]